MRLEILLILCLSGMTICSMFRFKKTEQAYISDIIKGLLRSDSKISSFTKRLPHDLIDELENDEQQAGQFVCQVLHGDIPGAIEDLGADFLDDVEDEWNDVTSFIQAIPTLAPAILEDIIQDGENVVSVVGDIFTNPSAAVTAIVDGVEVIVSDIENVGEDIWSGIECFFGDCAAPTTTANPAATLSASCQVIMAAATTTYSAVTTSSTNSKPAQTSFYITPVTSTRYTPASSSTYDPSSDETDTYYTFAQTTSTEVSATANSATTTFTDRPQSTETSTTHVASTVGAQSSDTGSQSSDGIRAAVTSEVMHLLFVALFLLMA